MCGHSLGQVCRSASRPAAVTSLDGATAAQELFYLGPDGKLMRAAIKAVASRNQSELSISAPVPMFTTPLDPSGFSTRSPWVLSTDDQRFLMPIAIDKPKPSTLVVILNWRPQP